MMPTDVTTASTNSDTKGQTDSKPVKLRSACNCCFAAKVRCDGNKEGCKRCSEKRLDCTYSESMVGKVVGKRRKRALVETKISDLSTQDQWNISVGATALPSPAPTNISEPQNKRNRVSNEWSDLVHYDDQSSLDFSACDEQFLNLDLCQPPEPTVSDEALHVMNDGMPTPTASPSEVHFLSPADLKARTPSDTPCTALPMNYQISNAGTSSISHQRLTQTDDDETACIKLLTQLKQFSAQSLCPLQTKLILVHKTNAAIKRILRSNTIATDYSCHLLLTSILMHLTAFCEHLLVLQDMRHQQREGSNQLRDESNDYEQPGNQGLGLQPVAKASVYESISLCVNVGNLLKRKPLHGFQILGRQESAFIDMERRLRTVKESL